MLLQFGKAQQRADSSLVGAKRGRMHCSRCCSWRKPQTGSDQHYAKGPGPTVALKLLSASLVTLIVVERLLLRI